MPLSERRHFNSCIEMDLDDMIGPQSDTGGSSDGVSGVLEIISYGTFGSAVLFAALVKFKPFDWGRKHVRSVMEFIESRDLEVQEKENRHKARNQKAIEFLEYIESEEFQRDYLNHRSQQEAPAPPQVHRRREDPMLRYCLMLVMMYKPKRRRSYSNKDDIIKTLAKKLLGGKRSSNMVDILAHNISEFMRTGFPRIKKNQTGEEYFQELAEYISDVIDNKYSIEVRKMRVGQVKNLYVKHQIKYGTYPSGFEID